MKVIQIPAESWAALSEEAHLIVFDKHKPQAWDRIDYALVTQDSEGTLATYLTAREMDAKTVYWQFGGAFPSVRGTVSSFTCYLKCIEWTKERYDRIFTLIENTNQTMLKFAMKAGFLIMGVRNFKGAILVELGLEFRES